LVSTGELDGRLDAINKSSFKVNPSNEFGPIAIAFRECEPVVLQNWRLIAEKISKPAQNVYTETNANSIVTIPIHLNVGRNLFRYVLWMQTNETRVFGKDFLKSARFIQNKINHILTAKVSRVASDTMLSLADSEVIQNAMHGASSYIREVGELLMVDLTKSTILSGILSYEDYEQLLSKYTEVLSDALCQLGYRLHMAKGDALLFTKNEVSGFVPRTVLFKMIASCDILLKGFVRKLVENDVYAYEPSFRLCSVTGDISRDLVKGARGGWAIVGSSINEVHKLESVAKLHREGIYFEFSIKAPEPGVDFISSEFSEWEGSPPIRYVKFASLEDKLAA